MTTGEEGGAGNMPSDQSKRVEDLKRTPYGRDVVDEKAEACS